MFETPYTHFELVSKKMQKIIEYGNAKNTRKPIYWRMTEGSDGIKRITAYQLGGANISMTIVPSTGNLSELVDFSHDGKFQQSVDLLATIVQHKGKYQRNVGA